MRISRLISRYIFTSILPYLGFAWLLLSVILFVQQATRYSEIFFSSFLPASLIWQLTFALIPNVIAFTCPMAVLIGVIIGLSKMQGDAEIIAIRASGIGNIQIALPILLLGILLSIFAFLINLKGVPFAAQIVRRVALQNAVNKLESPIEPGIFNSELKGMTIYVKNGDFDTGTWNDIFIYNEDKINQQVRLITAKNGRIDSIRSDGVAAENSELVLENANVNTFSIVGGAEAKLATETIRNFRWSIKTKREELQNRLSKAEETPEEMGIGELANFAATQSGTEKIEAQILLHRRILFSVTPFFFALLGAGLVLNFNRGGRGWGIVLALLSLIVYYLVALFSEQMARTGKISVFFAGIIPIILTCVACFWFFLSQRLFVGSANSRLSVLLGKLPKFSKTHLPKNHFVSFRTGILDFDIISSLVRLFLLTISFLASIYLIFTAFELWKFASSINHGVSLLAKYLVFLIPFIYIQIAPSALMIAAISTYVIKSRQNEVVTWVSSGQSIYRLLLPCFVLMLIFGGINWGIQETVLPRTNKIQDSIRNQIRNKGVSTVQNGTNWVASENRIYSFDWDETSKLLATPKVKNLNIYEFDTADRKLTSLIRVQNAEWTNDRIIFSGNAEKIVWSEPSPHFKPLLNAEIDVNEGYNPFRDSMDKPSHLTSREISATLNDSDSDQTKRSYQIALEKRKITALLPIVIILFAAPFGLALHHKGSVLTIGSAIALWLAFMGVGNTFEQYGTSGFLSPAVAVWSPLLIFGIIGLLLLSRVKT